MKLCISLVATLLLFASHTFSQPLRCGRQAGGALCPYGQCCSRFGRCGVTQRYCGNGCQSQCPTPPTGNEQCGWQAGGKLCPNGRCCSKFGYCGSGEAWCCNGCQSQCNEICPKFSSNNTDAYDASFIRASSFRSSGAQCGWQAGGKLCPNGLCCSKFGYCGSGEAWCCDGCQSQCNGSCPRLSSDNDDTGRVISRSQFEDFLKRNPSMGFYTYDAFIRASSLPGFGTTDDDATGKKSSD